jgi:predicted DNA-binding protein (UPF0251 family)
MQTLSASAGCVDFMMSGVTAARHRSDKNEMARVPQLPSDEELATWQLTDVLGKQDADAAKILGISRETANRRKLRCRRKIDELKRYFAESRMYALLEAFLEKLRNG